MNEITKPVAYLLCGFIGSGKTTFARKLEQETGAVRFTKDEWSVKIFGHEHNPSKDTFAEYDSRVTQLATEIALRCLQAGTSVIIDDGFWYKKQRDEMRQTLQDLGAVAKLYYIDTPVEVMRARTVKRSGNPPKDSFYITEEEFENYLKLFQPPIGEECISIKN